MIRAEKSISRIELSRKLVLSRSTVTLITKRLVRQELLHEVGKGNSTDRGGRRQVLLALNPRMGFVLAGEIELTYSRVALFDINANVIATRTLKYSKTIKAEPLISMLIGTFRELISEQAIRSDQLIGIGLGVPGMIDYTNGTVRDGHNTKRWDGYPLCRILSDEFQVPAFLENNVKSVTLGEYHFGGGRNSESLVCFWFGDGIGIGIMNQGQLIKGSTHSAGEIGFTELLPGIQSNWSLLGDDNNHIWGDVLSWANIQAAVQKGIESGWKTRLDPDCDVTFFLQAAEKMDPLAVHLVKLLGKLIAHIVSQAIYFYNPSVFVLSGPLFGKSHLLYQEISTNIQQNILLEPIRRTDFRISNLNENGVLIGAASLVINDLFRMPDAKNPNLTRSALMAGIQSDK